MKQFFEVEADEGNDSDEGKHKDRLTNVKDAFYEEGDLKRRNRGMNDIIADIQTKAYSKEERRRIRE